MVGAWKTERCSDGSDGRRIVPGKHLDRDALLGEVPKGLGRVLPQPLPQQNESDRRDSIRRPLPRSRAVREPAQRQNPEPLTGGGLGPSPVPVYRAQDKVRSV